MKEEIQRLIQQLIAGKTGVVVVGGTVTVPVWAEWVLHDPTAQAILVIAGFFLTLLLIVVHAANVIQKCKRLFNRWKNK